MTTVTETLIDGNPERYEQRYAVSLTRVPMRFVRRPVSITPDEGTVCFVDDGPRLGVIGRNTGAFFKGGKWHRVKWEPTHWTVWEGPEAGADAQ